MLSQMKGPAGTNVPGWTAASPLLGLFCHDFSWPQHKEIRLIMILNVPWSIPYFLTALDVLQLFVIHSPSAAGGQKVESSSITDVLLCGF